MSARRGRPWLTSGRGSTIGMRSPSATTAPQRRTRQHAGDHQAPPRDGGSVFAVRRGEIELSDAATVLRPARGRPAGRGERTEIGNAQFLLVVRNERATGDRRLRPRARVSYRRLNRCAGEDPSRLTSSCSAVSSSCSAASSSAASLHWAATSNRHHRCSMTHMHTAAATTTTAAADHQYATMAARTGTPTLARIGCRSAHDRRCMYSR